MGKVRDKVTELVKPIIENDNYELYNVEYKKEGPNWILRIFVDNKTRNISLDECVGLSRKISDILDEEPDINDQPYSLEISSPGLERLLRNDSDYEWASGKTLQVRYFDDDEKKLVVEGKLSSFDDEYLHLALSKKKSKSILKDKIDSAKRVLIFDEIKPKNAGF